MSLAERVAARRQELKMTQQELAQRMGLKSGTSIAKIESGREAKQPTIARLAQALDVTVPYLMGFEDSHPEDQAEFEASILMDDDTMEMIRLYRGLNDEQKGALKQMARVIPKT